MTGADFQDDPSRDDGSLPAATAQRLAVPKGAAALQDFFAAATSTISYVVHDPVTMRGAVICSQDCD